MTHFPPLLLQVSANSFYFIFLSGNKGQIPQKFHDHHRRPPPDIHSQQAWSQQDSQIVFPSLRSQDEQLNFGFLTTNR
jgi:hypothetical protein